MKTEVEILDTDFHFNKKFPVLPSALLVPKLQVAYRLINIAQHHRHLKCFLPISPRGKPDSQKGLNNLQKYGKFSEELDLCDKSTFLVGPFNFSPKDNSTPAQSILAEDISIKLSEMCQAQSMAPPSIGPPSADKVANVAQLRDQLGTSIITSQSLVASSLHFTSIIPSLSS